jgi:hypothetical protein
VVLLRSTTGSRRSDSSVEEGGDVLIDFVEVVEPIDNPAAREIALKTADKFRHEGAGGFAGTRNGCLWLVFRGYIR